MNIGRGDGAVLNVVDLSAVYETAGSVVKTLLPFVVAAVLVKKLLY